MVKKRAQKKSNEKKPPPDGDRAAAQACCPRANTATQREPAECGSVRAITLNDGLRRYRDETRRLQAEVTVEESR